VWACVCVHSCVHALVHVSCRVRAGTLLVIFSSLGPPICATLAVKCRLCGVETLPGLGLLTGTLLGIFSSLGPPICATLAVKCRLYGVETLPRRGLLRLFSLRITVVCYVVSLPFPEYGAVQMTRLWFIYQLLDICRSGSAVIARRRPDWQGWRGFPAMLEKCNVVGRWGHSPNTLLMKSVTIVSCAIASRVCREAWLMQLRVECLWVLPGMCYAHCLVMFLFVAT